MGSAMFNALHIKSLAADLHSALQDPSSLDQAGMNAAFIAAKKLTDALETPQNAITHQWVMPYSLACIKIAVDLNLFNALVENPDQSKPATELATRCGAEPLLIVRIMRILTSSGFAKEAGEAMYTATPMTEEMTNIIWTAGTRHYLDMNIESAVKLPDFLKSNGYKNPTTASQTPFQFAVDTKKSYFEWMQERPAIADNFHTYLAGRDKANKWPSWVDWYPIQQEVLNGAKDDSTAVTVVDVGGGKGANLVAFREKFPDAPGRFIFEDLKYLLDSAASLGNIEGLAYDFFTPQPIIGARLYFLASILHNWDDESGLQILKNVAAAMTRGYSKLILNERIPPDVGCSLLDATADIQMMLNFAGIERTQSQWRELLQRAGFQNVTFHLPPDSLTPLGIVEASL